MTSPCLCVYVYVGENINDPASKYPLIKKHVRQNHKEIFNFNFLKSSETFDSEWLQNHALGATPE